MAKEIKKMTAPTTVAGMQDSIDRGTTADEVTIPGRLDQWLNPRTKGKPVLDPVLLAAKGIGKKRGKKKVAIVAETDLPSAGADGLPRPGRK